MSGAARRVRTFVLIGVAALLLAVWAFPVLWALLTSFKTERDVLAYPPTIVFEPTLRNYRDVLFGSASILPNLVSSTIVAGAYGQRLQPVRDVGVHHHGVDVDHRAHRVQVHGGSQARHPGDHDALEGVDAAEVLKRHAGDIRGGLRRRLSRRNGG